MTFSPDANEYERLGLLQRIEAAQQLGQTVYLSSPAGMVVRVAHSDNAHAALEEARARGSSFDEIDFSYRQPSGTILSSGSIINGRGAIKREAIEGALDRDQLIRLLDVKELEALLEKQVGSADWRVWFCFLEHLTVSLPHASIHKLIVPLLEAGELPHIPEATEEYLEKVGFPEKEISKLFSADRRLCRRARATFQEKTHLPWSRIDSEARLGEALEFAIRQDADSYWFLPQEVISSFIEAWPEGADVSHVASIVSPFLSSGSYFDHDRLMDTISEKDWIWDWPASHYRSGRINLTAFFFCSVIPVLDNTITSDRALTQNGQLEGDVADAIADKCGRDGRDTLMTKELLTAITPIALAIAGRGPIETQCWRLSERHKELFWERPSQGSGRY